MRKTILVLVSALCAIVVLILTASPPDSPRQNTVQFLGFTNGLNGPMATSYQTMSATTVQRWLQEGTNAALVRVTNNQTSAIRLFPFARVWTNSQSPSSYQSILLNAPDFSGVLLPAGQATNMQVLVLAQSEDWRIELGYTRVATGSFAERLRNLPRDLLAFATKRGVSEHTKPIKTGWIQP